MFVKAMRVFVKSKRVHVKAVIVLVEAVRALVRGVLGNKCAGQHNLKTVHFREILASGNFLAWLSGISIFFCSPLSILGRRQQAFM